VKEKVRVLNSVAVVAMMKNLISLLKFVHVDIEHMEILDFVILAALTTANL